MFLQKGYPPNWSREVFVIKKVKNIVPWKKTNQKEFRTEKVIKTKM